MITRLLGVAVPSKTEVSSISAMNVLTPFNWESPAPTLARIESNMGIVDPESHGMKHPICAIRAQTPICLIYVLFPIFYKQGKTYRPYSVQL